MAIEKGPDPGGNGDIPVQNENEEDAASESSDEEYVALNNQLDELNGWLDHLEQKNADIQQQLLDLLQKSRSTREEFQRLTETSESSECDPKSEPMNQQ